ncbi:MAG TPA: glycosyltransferase [Candidatus Udaeobacter sp.]|nr:glycosyltransferase [Candidatus Udaeobacter sp.]
MKRDAVVMWTPGDLMVRLGQVEPAAQFEAGVWFYPSGHNDDDRMVEMLSHRAASIVLVPSPGADAATRRPSLVQCFERFGLLPDYDCDLTELDPTAVCLRQLRSAGAGELTPKVETAFARLNRVLGDLKQSLQIRDSELEGAHRHIAALEEKLLKLKEYRRELKLLKEQKQTLRKSPERRVGQILLAPYRLPEKLTKTIWKKLHRPVRERRRSGAASEYQEWFERHRANARDLERMRSESRGFVSRPLISVITPVFDTPVERLEEAIESVIAQAYENWELLLIDDGSSDPELLRALRVLAARDRRIILKNLGKHEGISAASNQGLALAQGEWVTFLDHDDVIEPDALFQIVKLLQTHPDADLIYSDEDKLGEDGFEAPLFKPNWSPDFFLSYNYVGHLTAVRRDMVQKAGSFRSQFDSAQDYDLFFRVIEQARRIHHIPRILYHWRRSQSSSAISVRQKPEQLEASRLAIEDHLKRRAEPARVAVDWRTHAFWVRRRLSEPKRISVIIWSRRGLESLKRRIESLTSRTSYPNYEIVIVRDDKFPGASDFSSPFPHHLLRFPGEPNDSAVKNFAVNQTNDPWILFLDESIEPIEPDWLTIMAEHVQRGEVGAVGARLLNPNGTIEQAGTVVGVNNTAQPAFHAFPGEHPGTNRQLQVTRNCSAVSSACMLTRREVLQQTGGFDASLGGTLADVDLCLKMRRAGYLIVYTPFAKLCWHEVPSDEIDVKGEAIMRKRWGDVLQSDPYYNPNLSRERADFSLGKLNIG